MTRAELASYYQEFNKKLLDIYTGQRPREPFYLSGYSAYLGVEEHSIAEENLRDWVQSLKKNLFANIESIPRDRTFRPLVLEHWGYGVHMIDTLFGAEICQRDDTAWSTGLKSEVGTLASADLNSPVIKRMLDVTDMLVEASEGMAYVTIPVLSCVLNIGANLYASRFYEAMLVDPEGAQRDMRTINDCIIALHRMFSGRIPYELMKVGATLCRFMPPGYGMVDGCANQLVSPKYYKENVAALDNEVLEVYPNGGLMHLCGASEQHIPTFREMPALATVQLNDRATEVFEEYYKGLRPDQIIYVCPTDNITIEKILSISNGGTRVVICACAPD